VKQLLACLVVALLAVGCDRNGGGSPTDPSQVNVEFSFSDLTPGTGAEAVAGSRVIMLYELWLYNPAGTASKGVRRGGSSDVGVGPYSFTVGTGGTIQGIDQGVRGMRAGGKRRIYMPPSMAYGSSGSQDGSIPPNASLVFEVELTSVQ
jgi:FKBP-type peptidyl-prolyl cis-trans isomerase FkpA